MMGVLGQPRYPLTPIERLAVREWQEDLQAVKRCARCHLEQPIGLFEYQAAICDPCLVLDRSDSARGRIARGRMARYRRAQQPCPSSVWPPGRTWSAA
jgi:hypothetical protein